MKSWSKDKKVLIRNPQSTRPWQHVLRATWGYFVLAAKLKQNKQLHGEAFNFGPNTRNYKVISLVQLIEKYWKGINWKVIKKSKKEFHRIRFIESKL